MLDLIFLKHSHTFYYLKKFVEIGIFISFRGYRSGHEHVQTQLNLCHLEVVTAEVRCALLPDTHFGGR